MMKTTSKANTVAHVPQKRQNATSVERFERWALPRMAKSLPQWVTPDHLTVLGLFAAVLIGAGFVLTSISIHFIWLSNGALILHWWADSLDGTLARERKIQRPRYGFFVDHYTDAISTVLICAGMGLGPMMNLSTSFALIIAYLAMSILVYLVSMARGVFKLNFGHMGPTEVRMIIFTATTVAWATANPTFTLFGISGKLFSWFGGVVATGLTGYFLVFGTLEAIRLAKMDPRPAKGSDESDAQTPQSAVAVTAEMEPRDEVRRRETLNQAG